MPAQVVRIALLGALALLTGCGREQPNVILVVLDTVRADAIGARLPGDEDGPSLTPNLDRLASESVSFETAYAPAPWTLPSHVSLFTGLLPFEHRAQHERFVVDQGLTTLAERFRDAGYVTAGFSCNPWLNAANGTMQGFERREEVYRWGTADREKGGRAATAIAGDWILDASERGRPFFAFINLFEAHLPYEPPDGVLDRLGRYARSPERPSVSVTDMERFILDPGSWTQEDMARARALYLGEVAFMDDLMGAFWERLSREGVGEDTILIIVSDHGEHFGDHGLMGHEFSLYESVLRVPFVLRWPARFPEGGVVSTPVSLVDVAPTLLDLVGEDHDGKMSGRSLLPLMEGERSAPEPILAAYAPPRTLVRDHWGGQHPRRDISHLNVGLTSIRVRDHKLIQSTKGKESLYDLSGDPDETRLRNEQLPDTLVALRRALFERILP